MRTRKRLDRRYLKDLDEILTDLFAVANEVHGWSTAQMARECGVCWNTIYNLETRKTRLPRFHTLWKIAGRLNFVIHTERVRGRKRAELRPAA